MKSQLVIFMLVSLIAFAHCFPGVPRDHEREDSDEISHEKPNIDTVLVIPNFHPALSFDDDSNEDDQYNPFRFNFRSRFGDFFDDIQKMFSPWLSRLPTTEMTYPLGKIPHGANSTSTTKVIDGHVVVINETTYSDDNPNSTFIFKVRTVDVKPENTPDIHSTGVDGDDTDIDGGEQIEKDKEPKSSSKSADKTTERSVETVEDPGNNEIPDSQVETLRA